MLDYCRAILAGFYHCQNSAIRKVTNKMKINDSDPKHNNNRFTIDYWLCSCGKENSNHSEICVKCGKQRPIECAIKKISY